MRLQTNSSWITFVCACTIACTPLQTHGSDSQDASSLAQQGTVWVHNHPYVTLIGVSFTVMPYVFNVIKYPYDRYIKDKVFVGRVSIDGPIEDAHHYVRRIQEMFERWNTDAILLNISSPGGAAGSSEVIYHEIKRLKATYDKPIVAWVENVCASGAYYIASACDEIITSSSAIVGSIGVILPQWRLNKLIEAYNIKRDNIQTGEYKDAMDPFTEQEPHERSMLQSISDSSYERFTKDVQQARPILANKDTAEWANGKVFSGTQAQQYGLVDITGSISTMEDHMRKVTGRTGEVRYIIPIEEVKTLLDHLNNVALNVTDRVMYNMHTLHA